MYSNVLVPTDGSQGTRGAVEHAIDHAKRYDATLHALYVVDTQVGLSRKSTPESVHEELSEHGREIIDDVITQAKSADAGTIEGAVAQGHPHRAILDYTDENDVDLIVMGTHGRTGLDHYLLGSVTEKVVRLAPVPVLTVPLTDE